MLFSTYFFGQSNLNKNVKSFIEKAQLNDKELGSIYVLKVDAPAWAPKNCKKAFVAFYVSDAEHDSFVDYLREGKIEANGRKFENIDVWAVYDSTSKTLKNKQVRLTSDKQELRRIVKSQVSCNPFAYREPVDMTSTYSPAIAGAYLVNGGKDNK